MWPCILQQYKIISANYFLFLLHWDHHEKRIKWWNIFARFWCLIFKASFKSSYQWRVYNCLLEDQGRTYNYLPWKVIVGKNAAITCLKPEKWRGACWGKSVAVTCLQQAPSGHCAQHSLCEDSVTSLFCLPCQGVFLMGGGKKVKKTNTQKICLESLGSLKSTELTPVFTEQVVLQMKEYGHGSTLWVIKYLKWPPEVQDG